VATPDRVRRFLTTKSVRRNTLANLVARVISAALAFAAIPILLSKLGAEAYGLVGLAVVLESLFALLDLGLSTAVNREVARNIGTNRDPEANRDLLRTLEAIYWPIGLVILVAVIVLAVWLASGGLNTDQLSESTVQLSLSVLAFTLTIRWPLSLYAGVLRGLEAQLLYNGLQLLGPIIRLAGGVAVVTWVSPTVEAFFVTDLVGSIVQIVLIAAAAWRSLPPSSQRPRFRFSIIQSLWRFALAYNAIVILTQLLMQSGTLFVARMLPLRDVGFYAVASSLAGVVIYVPYALVEASFPRFTSELERRNVTEFSSTYRFTLNTSALSIMAVAVPIVFFSKDFLFVWTRSSEVASHAAAAAAMLAIGSLLYALWAFPYTALLSAGLVRYPLIVNLVVVPLALAVSPYAISTAGLPGAAAVWVAASACFLSAFPIALGRKVSGTAGMNMWARPVAIVMTAVGAFGVLSLATKGWSSMARLAALTICDLALSGATAAWLLRRDHRWRWAEERRR